MIVALLISIPAGVRSARRRNRWDDRAAQRRQPVGLSFPNFALGPVLILFFAIDWGATGLRFGNFCSSDFAGDHDGRSAGRDPHAHGPDRHAGRARTGLHSYRPRQRLAGRWVVYSHALRNAMVPVLTVVGLQFGALLAGAIVTETIFSWPGIGRLTIRPSAVAITIWCRDAF